MSSLFFAKLWNSKIYFHFLPKLSKQQKNLFYGKADKFLPIFLANSWKSQISFNLLAKLWNSQIDFHFLQNCETVKFISIVCQSCETAQCTSKEKKCCRFLSNKHPVYWTKYCTVPNEAVAICHIRFQNWTTQITKRTFLHCDFFWWN